MSLLTFNFCGVDAVADLDLIVNDIRMPVTPEITENVQQVPGMVGAVFLGNTYGQKVFEIEVTIKANDSAERVDRIHELTELVMTFGDGEYPMVFSNDSQYTYYGHFTNISVPERVVRDLSWATVTMTFTCSNPKGYGQYTTFDVTENPTSIYPNGRSECYPIFTCIPKQDVQKIAVASEDGEYVFLGEGVDLDTGEALQNLEPLVVSDECDALSNWTPVTTPTFEVENGVVRGSIFADQWSFGVSSFGAAYGGKWHGPLISRWLPGAYNDFRIRIRLANRQYYPRAMGKIELYLLNNSGGRIGKIMLRDSENSKVVTAQVQLGTTSGGTHKDLYFGAGAIKQGRTVQKTIRVKNGTKTVTYKGKTTTVQLWRTVTINEDLDTGVFTDFYGYIELKKIGNKYRVEILKLDSKSNPAWTKPIVINWTDTSNTYSGNNLAGIALYCAKYDITEDTANPVVAYRNNGLSLSGVQVWNIIDGGNDSTKPKTIAHAGDEIKINCENHNVYKNGAYFMDKFYIGSQFLTMNGGIYKTFAFEPGLDKADWYVEYRPTTN
jgi:predicted phage tail component-like protein